MVTWGMVAVLQSGVRITVLTRWARRARSVWPVLVGAPAALAAGRRRTGACVAAWFTLPARSTLLARSTRLARSTVAAGAAVLTGATVLTWSAVARRSAFPAGAVVASRSIVAAGFLLPALPGLEASLGEQIVETRRVDTLEHTEVRRGQPGVLEVVEQRGALAHRLILLALQRLLFAAQGLALLAHRIALLAQGFALLLDAGLLVAPPTRDLGGSGFAMLGGDLTGGLAIEIEARAAARHRIQVGRGAGVTAEKRRQTLPWKYTGCALLNVGLDAQFEWPRGAIEQRRELLPKQLTAGSHRQWRLFGLSLGGSGLGRRRRGVGCPRAGLSVDPVLRRRSLGRALRRRGQPARIVAARRLASPSQGLGRRLVWWLRGVRRQ